MNEQLRRNNEFQREISRSLGIREAVAGGEQGVRIPNGERFCQNQGFFTRKSGKIQRK